MEHVARIVPPLSIVLALLAGCGSQNFSGGGGASKKASSPPASNPDAPATANPPDTSYDAGQSCFKVQPTFNFMFVIDKTASMDPSIRTVIQKVGSFAQKIGSITLPGASEPIKDSKFGAISYIDSESENMTVDFTSDSKDFADKLALHNVRRNDGGNPCEGGLMAAKLGLQKLGASMAGGKPIVPVMIVISDNYSHDGSNVMQPSFSDTAVVSAGTGSAFKPLILIDSTPTAPLYPGFLGRASMPYLCVPSLSTSPSQQWSELRTKLGSANGLGQSALGSGIGFQSGNGF